MRTVTILLAALLALPTSAAAEGRVRRRARRDRFTNTVSLGGTAGVGSPLGLLGAFVEYRPARWFALGGGGGLGGSFGPAAGATAYLDPIVTRGFAMGVGGSLSHNFSYVHGTVVEGRRPLPSGTNWASVEVEMQVRPSRHVFVRVGFGRGFLLDTAAFRLGSEAELAQVHLPTLPGVSPVDAIRAAARGEQLGVWFVHLDVAGVWRL